MSKAKYTEVSQQERDALRSLEQAVSSWARGSQAAVVQDPGLYAGMLRMASLSLERASRLLREAADAAGPAVMEQHNRAHPLRARHLRGES